MSDADKFREYAQDCIRLAKRMTGNDKEALLEIAKAWEECARRAEAKAKSRVTT